MTIEELRLQLKESRKIISEQADSLSILNDSLADDEDLTSQLNTTEKRCNALQFQVDTLSPRSEKFLSSDEKVKYYTGLPSCKHFSSLLQYLHPKKEHGNSVLTKEAQLLMVFMKLRLNLRHKDLAYRFGISKTTISTYVIKWIDLMFTKLKPLIGKAWEWTPLDEEMKKTVPMCFRKTFPDVKTIIDCFEIRCDSPKSLQKKNALFSHYKHYTSVKTMLGCTSHGCVNYLSRPFLGRMSDKQIVMESGFLKQLKPGDQVMADRGFAIQDLLDAVGAHLIIPHFKGRESQLSHLQVEESREVSNVRIHIERVIGLGKNVYTILNGPLKPYTMKCDDDGISFVEKVITVCYSLVNLLPRIVPIE